MTREGAERYIKSEMCKNCSVYLGGGKCSDNCKVIEAIEALEQEPKWIPVSEGLPSENGCYLVSTTGTNNDIIDIAYYTKEIWHKASRIKAWMPLPEPYKSESEDT